VPIEVNAKALLYVRIFSRNSFEALLWPFRRVSSGNGGFCARGREIYILYY
jgi:hypothetical protein